MWHETKEEMLNVILSYHDIWSDLKNPRGYLRSGVARGRQDEFEIHVVVDNAIEWLRVCDRSQDHEETWDHLSPQSGTTTSSPTYRSNSGTRRNILVSGASFTFS